jgi:hypothetical protein
MNCIVALRRCSLTFAVLVRSCGFRLVVDCALIAHGADGGKGIGRFISLRHIRRLAGLSRCKKENLATRVSASSTPWRDLLVLLNGRTV